MFLLPGWDSFRSMMTHQDLRDFLQFLLEFLKPYCWNSAFVPRWLLAVGDKNEVEEKHSCWSAVCIASSQFSNWWRYKSSSTFGMTKQDLKRSWTRLMVLRLLALFLDRLGNMNHINKSTSCVQLPFRCYCLIGTQPQQRLHGWKTQFKPWLFIREAGCVVRAHNLWWHYDDGAVPTKNFTCWPSETATIHHGMDLQKQNMRRYIWVSGTWITNITTLALCIHTSKWIGLFITFCAMPGIGWVTSELDLSLLKANFAGNNSLFGFAFWLIVMAIAIPFYVRARLTWKMFLHPCLQQLLARMVLHLDWIVCFTREPTGTFFQS